MSVINEEIVTIEKYVFTCLDQDAPIDSIKIKRLSELRRLRLEELVSTHQQRMEIMKTKTRELTAKISFTPEEMQLHAGSMDKLHTEFDLYNSAATQWVINGSLPLWEESEAASIAIGILILAGEIYE